jgi:FixJ family two-component response regulator
MNGHDACVVVVDDDMSIRESLSNLIRSTGRKVKTFASAQEFLAGPRPEVPGCLVLDVQFPGLSGLDLQEELAKVQPEIPIIFISGHGDIPMTVRAMKAGAIEFLTKPFHDEDLLNAIEQGMQCARQSPQAEKKPGDKECRAGRGLHHVSAHRRKEHRVATRLESGRHGRAHRFHRVDSRRKWAQERNLSHARCTT